MPSWELFDEQPKEYRDGVLPPEITARVAVEQGSTLGWERYVGARGHVIGMKTFGASAPLKELQKKFGFEPDRVVAVARNLLGGGWGVPVRVLCVNSGSSSLKVALYEDETAIASSAVEGIGLDEGRLTVRDASARVLHDQRGTFPDVDAAIRGALGPARFPAPDAAGHRVVHGGADHTAPERVTPELLAALRTLVPLAPLHLPAALPGIDAVSRRFPGLPQVACFDPAFHGRMPAVAQRLPLPRALGAKGIQRYGFHGLSYEYVVATIGAATLGRAVIAHL